MAKWEMQHCSDCTALGRDFEGDKMTCESPIDISQFPRATYASPYLDFPVENTYGYSLKIALRKAAKKTEYYFMPVQPVRYGRTDSGEDTSEHSWKVGFWCARIYGTLSF